MPITVEETSTITGNNGAESLSKTLTLLTPEMAERLKALTEGVAVDLDAPIEGDVDL